MSDTPVMSTDKQFIECRLCCVVSAQVVTCDELYDEQGGCVVACCVMNTQVLVCHELMCETHSKYTASTK